MVVDLNCVDVTVNLQTWVMLLDFMTISPTVNEKVVRGSQAVSDFLNDMSDPNKVNELDVSVIYLVKHLHMLRLVLSSLQ